MGQLRQAHGTALAADLALSLPVVYASALPEYGISRSYYRSFLRLHGSSSEVSAVDVVYGVTVLQESFAQAYRLCSSGQFGISYVASPLSGAHISKGPDCIKFCELK